MAGFVAQVWVLCAVAFVLGSGVTWLLFVRPLREARPMAAAPPVAPAAEPVPAAPREEPRLVDPAAPPTDPALSALEAPARPRGTGVRASDALDRLGVSPSGLAPTIPTQHGPADEETP
ncbi:hypothetical protein [Pseudonocardia abyssalis]|uniref:Uncharacterized protein n=1 Tax=Pseudonocardia abyssalis TaxID=2792008 RepID=A0ABS6V0B8_9PSEU|nr:hypothetical protein [Pseudonocardia abyssalis]MBW0115111.1 hypothetical protein [Pseudonocardia abyssalis]MBW0137950.1 hypothetical protein [Pseudonocardia abyssalis]